MDRKHATLTLSTNKLPAYLRALVKLTKLRPSKVEVTFTDGSNTVTRGWRQGEVVTLGLYAAEYQQHWMGSDGEPNTTTYTTTSHPAAVGTKKAGSRPSTVRITVGNASPEMIDELNKQRHVSSWGHPSDHCAQLVEVALDQALEQCYPVSPVTRG